MIFLLDKDLWKDTKENVVKTDLDEVILRLESGSRRLKHTITVYDRYHVEIGRIRSRSIWRGRSYEIYYDEQKIATLSKKRGFLRKKIALKLDDGKILTVKGDLKKRNFEVHLKRKLIAKASPEYAYKNTQFGIETKDAKNRYLFICVAIVVASGEIAR